MRFGVVIFPGSNCDQDIIHVLRDVMGCEVLELWHKNTDLGGLTTNDCVVLPGGFSYGDALRTGAIARFSPIMQAVTEHCNMGGFAWGICNGFQILCEAGLLPGVLLENAHQQFTCKNVWLKAANHESMVNAAVGDNALCIPIAHAEGRYYADAETIQTLEDNKLVLFRYCDANGVITDASNPNGSVNNIAGVCNAGRNVYGMMPHPERAAEGALGNTDGYRLFASFLTSAGVPVA